MIGNDGRYNSEGNPVLELSSVDTLNNTTAKTHGTVPFVNITKVLTGAAAVTVAINIPYQVIAEVHMGVGGNPSSNGGGGGGATTERPLKANTDYLVEYENEGATTATFMHGQLEFYKEKYDKTV